MSVTSRFLCAGQSHAGRVRQNNEDKILVDAERGIFLVVDGLGGHNAGEKAAEIAVELITARLARQTGTVEERIREAITLANNEILRLAKEEQAFRGMACVLTLVVMDERDAVVGQVGDSRLYELTPVSIRKVTRDQSPVGELEDNQMLSEAEAMRHPRRNEVYRDVGSEERQPDDRDWVELHRITVRGDHALLLCSDGLSDQVTSKEIRMIVERFAGSPEQAVIELIAAANQAGGKDNVSVVLIQAPQYAKAVGLIRTTSQNMPVIQAPDPYPVWRKALLYLAGLVSAVLLFVGLQPHLESTGTGKRLEFGVVRMPTSYNVGPGLPVTSINAALQQASPGDAVVVAPGVYDETVRLREGVRLISRQRHGAVLQGPDMLVIAEGISSGSIEGFRLEGGAKSAFGVTLRDANVQILDLRISGVQAAGISIRGSSTATVRASRIAEHSGVAISISDSARPEITNNVLAPGRGSRSPTIEITGTARPVIVDNIVYEGVADTVWTDSKIDLSQGLRQTNVFVPANKPAPLRPARRQ